MGWICEVCGTPIEDGAGYVTVNYAALAEYKRAEREWEERERAKTPGSTWQPVDLSGYPERVPWRTLHGECDPEPSSADYWYGVERLRSAADVLERTAHLLGKNWLTQTDWDDMLRKIAKAAS